MQIQNQIPSFLTRRTAECRAFYVEHFGMKLTWDSEPYVGLRSQGPAGKSFDLAFLQPQPGQEEYRGGATIGFEVADVDAEYDRLVRAGLTVLAPPSDNPWGDRSFRLVDPIGVGVYVYKPIPVSKEMQAFVRE